MTSLVDTSGSVQERYVYDPFGVVTILDANWNTRSVSQFASRYLFQGLRFDAVTGLYYSRNRDYSPTLGRFLEQDPLGFNAGDDHLYRYVHNDPITHVDPFGDVDYKGAKLVDPETFDKRKLGAQGKLIQYDAQKKLWFFPNYGHGEIYEVKTTAGNTIYVYKITRPLGDTDEERKAHSYYCHALTFGGKLDDNGPFYLPSESSVATILRDEYTQIDCAKAQKWDIAVWYNAKGQIQHSATFAEKELGGVPGKISPDTRFLTKNDWRNERPGMNYVDINRLYPGTTVKCFRKKTILGTSGLWEEYLRNRSPLAQLHER